MAESEASQDEQLALKKRARRRLVGAAALALLAAIVLPMVMDREPRPANQDIQVRIPNQDAPSGIAARVLPSSKPTATPLPPPAPAADAPAATDAKTAAPAAAKPEAKPEAAPAKPAAAPVAAADKPAEKPAAAKPAEKAAEKPAEKPAAKPAEKPADKPADKKKAEEARAANALAGDAAEQWVIQLGAYKEAGNVKLLLSKLKGMGVPAFTEKFDSPQGPRTRVRAGPFPSKEAAEKAKVKVKVIGVDGPIAPK